MYDKIRKAVSRNPYGFKCETRNSYCTACQRNSVKPLCFCFDLNYEMEGRRELNDILNCFEDLKPVRAHKNGSLKIYK